MAPNGGRLEANEHFPSLGDADKSYMIRGFRTTSRKLPILKAEPIERMSARLGITVPEMIFGDNLIAIEHPATGWAISFNAFDALDQVDKTGESMLQVAHSKEWQRTRQDQHENINRVIKPFDWSYTTDFKGTLHSELFPFVTSTKPIPLDLLRRPDPILFFDEVVLYEDEMADNGITMLSCKVRVMAERLLLLCRFFMRLDNVLFRIRDTRIFIEFKTGQVIREYVEKEEDYEVIRERLSSDRDDTMALMRDPNRLSEILPTKHSTLEEVIIRG